MLLFSSALASYYSCCSLQRHLPGRLGFRVTGTSSLQGSPWHWQWASLRRRKLPSAAAQAGSDRAKQAAWVLLRWTCRHEIVTVTNIGCWPAALRRGPVRLPDDQAFADYPWCSLRRREQPLSHYFGSPGPSLANQASKHLICKLALRFCQGYHWLTDSGSSSSLSLPVRSCDHSSWAATVGWVVWAQHTHISFPYWADLAAGLRTTCWLPKFKMLTWGSN